MNKKSLIKSNDKAKYVIIRQYVVDTVMAASGKPERLESMRDLALKFDVSFATIQRALGTLIEEGLLTVHKGVGIYTNPEPNAERQKHQAVAIVVGSGRMLYYDNYLWDLICATGKQVTDRYYHLHVVNLLDNERSLDDYLNSLDLSAVFWLCPTIGGLKEKWESVAAGIRHPLVTFNAETPGISSVMLDFEHEGYLVGRRFAEHGVKKALIVQGGENKVLPLRGFLRAWKEAGFPEEALTVIDTNIGLEKILADGHCDGLYFYGGMLRGGGEILLRSPVDWQKTLLAGDQASWNLPLPGIAVSRSAEEISMKLWNALNETLSHKSPSRQLAGCHLTQVHHVKGELLQP